MSLNDDVEDSIFESLFTAISQQSIDGSTVHIGTDMVSVSRVESALEQEGLKEYVFTDNEIEYCESKLNPSQHYAARWAGKESAIKALPQNGRPDYNNIEIVSGQSAPTLNIENADIIRESAISLTHDDTLRAALAFVVVIV